MMKISIIVPVYNTEPYLPRCLDSILNQSFTDFELLLIDDGSRDNSGVICDAYAEKDSRIRVFHKENSGVSSARNLGLNMAEGEWMFFVDSDDWLELNAIELLMDKQIETGADIVSGGRLAHGLEGDYEIPLKQCQTNDEMVHHMMDNSGGQYVWGRLIRRRLLDDHHVRCVVGLDFAEDRLLMTQAACFANGFGYVNNIIYHYERRNANSILFNARANCLPSLRACCQEVSNYVVLEEFFKDKKPLYQESCRKIKEKLAFAYLVPSFMDAVENTSREETPLVVSIVDSYPLVHPMLRWKRVNIFGKGCHGIRLLLFCIKAERYIVKRLKRLRKSNVVYDKAE